MDWSAGRGRVVAFLCVATLVCMFGMAPVEGKIDSLGLITYSACGGAYHLHVTTFNNYETVFSACYGNSQLAYYNKAAGANQILNGSPYCGNPMAVFVQPGGQLWVACYGSASYSYSIVWMSSISSTPVGIYSFSNCNSPYGVTAASQTEIWISCYSTGILRVILSSPTSYSISTWSTFLGYSDARCTYPIDAYYESGYVYFACYSGGSYSTISIRTSDLSITGLTTPSQCSNPRNVLALPNGEVYAACSGNGIVIMRNSQGSFTTLASSSQCSNPFGVAALNSAVVYASCTGTGIIQIMGSSISVLTDTNGCSNSYDIAVTSSGNLYYICYSGGTTTLSGSTNYGTQLMQVQNACPAGKYYTTDGKCVSCPAGTYSTTAGTLSCTSCGVGMTSPTGSTSFSQCIYTCEMKADPLAAIRPPYIDVNASTFTSRTVNLAVKVSAAYDSNTFQFIGGNNDCETYASWTDGILYNKDCYKTYTRSTPWSTANPSCGLKRTSTANEIWYIGYLLAKSTQQVKLGDGSIVMRKLTNLLGYAIRYPLTVTATQQATILRRYPMEWNDSMVNTSVTAAAIYSWNASVSPLGGELVIVTKMPYPYYLTSGPTLFAPNDLIASVDFDPMNESTCSNSTTLQQQCVQYWRIKVAPINQNDQTRCSFSGNYALQFLPSCHAAALGRRYLCTLTQTNVTATLQTSNYCPYLTPIAVGVTGTLTTYSDEKLTSQSSTFDLMDTVYVKLVVDGQAQVTSVKIQEVDLQLSAPVKSDIDLVTDGTPISSGNLANANIGFKNSDQIGTHNAASINFDLIYDYIPIDRKASTLGTLKVTAGVTFANTDGTSSRRLLSFESHITPPSLKDRKFNRNFAKVIEKREQHHNTFKKLSDDPNAGLPFDPLANINSTEASLIETDASMIETMLLESGEPVMRAEAAFIIGSGRFNA